MNQIRLILLTHWLKDLLAVEVTGVVDYNGFRNHMTTFMKLLMCVCVRLKLESRFRM